MRRRRSGELAANLCVALASMSLAYLAIELLVFPSVLPRVPLDRQIDIHEGIRALTQSSKSGTLPVDYVAIVGDSYAQGAGDWFLAVDKRKNPSYNVTHLIHEWTGRDAITFGASGAGSLRGIVAEPVSQLEFMRATGRFRVESPDVFVVYFYEGNDLDDNIEDVAARYGAAGGSQEPSLDAVSFASFIDDTVVRGDPLCLQASEFRWYDNMFVADFAYRTVRRMVRYAINGREAYEPPPPEWHWGSINRALVGGKEVGIPDALQGPAMELSEDEIDLGVDVFEQALLYLGRRFPDSDMCVMYVPSPLSSYELVSPTVSCQTYHGRGAVYPSSFVRERSDEIAARIREVAARAGVPFADAREAVLQVSSEQFVHGPLDWRHMNRKGMETLAGTVLVLTEELEH